MTAILERRNTLFLFFLSLAILGSAVSCTDLSKEDTRKVNKALKDSLTSTTETWKVDMNIIKDGRKKIRLQGSQAISYTSKKKNETHIKGPVTIFVFDSTGAIKNRVHSKRAIYYSEDAIFKLFGDVKVNTTDGRHLKSEFLKWQEDKNKISTPKFVIITSPQDSIAGTGFEGTTDLKDYTIEKPKGSVIIK